MIHTVEIISSEDTFKAYREEWNRLLQESNNNTITLTWEWLYTWWEVFKDTFRKLMIIMVRDKEGQLIGIAPLLLRKYRPFPASPMIRRLEFLASGEDEDNEICSDYLNFIIQQGKEGEVTSTILNYITHNLSSEWDEIFLDYMLESSKSVKYLEDQLKEGALRYFKNKKGPCLYISLPDSYEKFLKNLSPSLRYKIRRDYKKLLEQGDVMFHSLTRKEELEQYMTILINLHQKRWSEREKPGVFSNNSHLFLDFHRRFSSISFQNNWIDISFLSLDKEPIAAIFNFKYNKKIYFYQSGVNTNLPQNISPGHLLHAHCIKQAIIEGFEEYDLLLGKHEYKRRWAKEYRNLISIKIFSQKVLGKLVRNADLLKQYIRSSKYLKYVH